MKCEMIYLIAAAAGASLLYCKPVSAAAMRCSGEEKTCLSNCTKILDSASNSTCVNHCRARQTLCLHIGCWDNGTVRYCGLLKK